MVDFLKKKEGKTSLISPIWRFIRNEMRLWWSHSGHTLIERI